MGRVTTQYRVLRLTESLVTARPDTLAAEEPLEIRVGGRPVAIIMRTPGDDFDLARGFLVGEGIVAAAPDVAAIRYCAGGGGTSRNVLDVTLGPGVPPPDASLEHHFYATSSCGLCGKASLQAIRAASRWPVAADPVRLAPGAIAAMPRALRDLQKVVDRTGGMHAAALFAPDGDLLCAREDVGRHNAVDKVVGWALGAGRLPLAGTALLVSGRASFELAQKAVMAGIPVLAAVSVPSSLAVDLARDMGLTLVGFVRGSAMTIYAHGERLGVGSRNAGEPGGIHAASA